MRLLLDEMFPPEVARALRERGHDVVAVAERAELVGLGDVELFAAAQREQRAVVTENVVDFIALDARYRAEGTDHCGLLFVLKRGLPRKRPQFVGSMTRTLDTWLTAHRELDARGMVAWP